MADDLTPEELLELEQLRKLMQLEAEAAKEPSTMGRLKAAGSGLAEGALSTLGVVGDIQQAGKQLSDYTRSFLPPGLQSADRVAKMLATAASPITAAPFPTTKKLTQVSHTEYEPQDEAEKMIKSISGGVGGAVTGGIGSGMSLLNRAGLGGLVGGASQLGENAWGPEGRIAAALLAAIVPGYFQMRQPNVVRAHQKTLKEIGPDELKRAAEAVKEAKAATGAPYLLTQGLSKKTPLSGYAELLLKEQEGAPMRGVLQEQTETLGKKMQELAASPTPTRTNQFSSNRIANALIKAEGRAREHRTAAVRPYYEEASADVFPTTSPRWTLDQGQLLRQESVIDIARRLRQSIRENHLMETPSGDALERWAARLDNLIEQEPSGVNVLNLDNLKKSIDKVVSSLDQPGANSAELAAKAGHMTAAKIINDAITRIGKQPTDGILPAGSKALREGQDIYEFLTKTSVEPERKSALTALATDDVVRTGKGDYSVYLKIFDDKHGPADIAFVGSRLNQEDKEAWPLIFKKWMEKRLNESGGLTEGRPRDTKFGSFPYRLWGEPGSVEREKFIEAVKQTAIARGENPDQAVAGTSKLLTAFEMAARDRATLGGIDTARVFHAEGANFFTTAVRALNILKTGLASSMERYVAHNTREQMAQLFASEDGVKTLVRIADHSMTTQRIQQAFLDAMALKGSAEATNTTAGEMFGLSPRRAR